MLGFVKMSALSAVLSFGLVTVYNQGPGAQTSGGKPFQERLLPGAADDLTTGSLSGAASSVASHSSSGPKGDRLDVASTDCKAQAWPHLAQSCLTRTDGRPAPARVRMITFETREGANTSVLRRVPQTELARR
jgi:hypothetical protein